MFETDEKPRYRVVDVSPSVSLIDDEEPDMRVPRSFTLRQIDDHFRPLDGVPAIRIEMAAGRRDLGWLLYCYAEGAATELELSWLPPDLRSVSTGAPR